MKKKIPKGCIIAIVIVVIIIISIYSYLKNSYNSMVTLDEGVKAKWSQVENVYQRRYDLIPNLVNTVKGYAAHEKETFQAVTEARSKAGGTFNISEQALIMALASLDSISFRSWFTKAEAYLISTRALSMAGGMRRLLAVKLFTARWVWAPQ